MNYLRSGSGHKSVVSCKCLICMWARCYWGIYVLCCAWVCEWWWNVKSRNRLFRLMTFRIYRTALRCNETNRPHTFRRLNNSTAKKKKEKTWEDDDTLPKTILFTAKTTFRNFRFAYESRFGRFNSLDIFALHFMFIFTQFMQTNSSANGVRALCWIEILKWKIKWPFGLFIL